MVVYRPTAVRPGTIHHSMIDQLSPALQMTIKIASVIGLTFTGNMLAAVYPQQDGVENLTSQMEELLQTGLIQKREGGYAFANSFIQEAAYERMLFAQRRQLHRALAAWYEEEGTQDTADFYTQLAHHWQQAEETAKTMQYLEKAAEFARAQGDIDQAVRLYDRALKLEAGAAVLTEEYDQVPGTS